MSKYINEAFRKFTLLEDSEDFDITPEGIDNLSSFMDTAMHDEDTDVQVIDPEAENEDKLKQSYVGKIICDCNVCHSHIFFNKEDIVIDEDDIVNADEECPYCMSTDGYTIIGEIKNWSPEVEDEIEDEPSDEEMFDDELADKPIEIEDEEETEVVEEGLKLDGVKSLRGTKGLRRRLEKDGVKSLRGRANSKISGTEDLTESIEDVTINTEDETMTMTTKDDGGVVVETSPRESFSDDEPLDMDMPNMGDEVIAPLDAETEDEILDNSEDEDFDAEEEVPEEEVAVDEFDEESFDELGEAYLRRNYDNVRGFKTTQIKVNENLLKIDGIITFKSGNQKKTNFIFESTNSAKGKFIFEGYNQQITGKGNAFRMKCSIQNKKIIPESIKYNYTSKNALNESVKLTGTVKTNRK